MCKLSCVLAKSWLRYLESRIYPKTLLKDLASNSIDDYPSLVVFHAKTEW